MPSASIQAIASQDNALLDLLTRWAGQNSGSSNIEGLEAMRGLLRQEFAKLPGAVVEEIPLPNTKARALRITRQAGAGLRVLCSGHYDTVYGEKHPFQSCTRLDDKRLGGPGVADMKGGLVVMLATLRAFEAGPCGGKLAWTVLLTPDEETGSEGSRSLIMQTAREQQLGLVFEPARGNGDLVRSRMGIGTFKVTCKGRAAHAARVPNDGRNAIVALAEFLMGAHRLPEVIPGILLNIGNIRGGGPINIVPDLAEAEINIRINRKSEALVVEKELQALAAPINAREGLQILIEGSFDRGPKECGPVEEALFAAWKAAGKNLGLAPFDWQHAGGGSDGNLLSEAGLPNLDGLGVVGDHLHSDREYCDVASLAQRAQLAATILELLARGEIKIP